MPSNIIAVANTKGGVGKTTLAGNLAWAYASKLERKVLLVDCDPNASATAWFDLAADDVVPFERIQLTTARLLSAQLPKLRKTYDLIVLDCPPQPMQSTDVTASAVTASSLALVPVQPSPLDVLAYSTLVPLLHSARAMNRRLQVRFVINHLRPGTVLGREASESFEGTEIELCKTLIHDRQAYRRVVQRGVSVVSESGPAGAEILELAEELLAVVER